MKTAHYTNFGITLQPSCADGCGFLHYREDFIDLPEDEWTEAEELVARMCDYIWKFNEGK